MTRQYKLGFASLTAVALVTGVGCRPADEADEFRNAVPREETVKMSVPQQAGGQALVVEVQAQALEQGKTADFLQLTRAVSGVVNGGGGFVLALVKTIVHFPPTTVDAMSATWGPWMDRNDPVAWRLTVTKVGEHKYEYRLDGRDKTMATASFTTVLSGVHTAAVDAAGLPIEGFGSGSFVLDWDARNTLPAAPRPPLDNQPDVGKAIYTYARLSDTADVSVDAQFRQVKDNDHPGQRVDADYRYRQTPGAGGSMEFVHAAPRTATSQAAIWAVKSRWTKEGAGRSDVKARGGDIPAGTEATASECWDASYASRYAAISWWPLGNYGTEATDCVFKTAEYTSF
jgi:hypothetical protein